MNPKVSITVNAKNRAIASVSGMLTVGSKVDVEIVGLPDGIVDWAQTDKFVGKSLRLRIVDYDGRDLVRYPRIEKSTSGDGDKWDVDASGKYETYSGCFVDFDTDKMRKAFCGIPFDGRRDFGIVLDSVVDSAQFATGTVTICQWSNAATEDPTVLPDWRETLNELNTKLGQVDSSATAAANAATEAQTAKTTAENASASAQSYATAALNYQNESIVQAGTATTKANAASASATAASGYAAAAAGQVEKYPYINEENNHWMVWDADEGSFVDTGVVAEGEKGDKGDTGATGADGADGVSPAVTITQITNGHRVTITDATHPSGQSFDVMNGTGAEGKATKPTTGSLADDPSFDEVVTKINTLIAQLKA